MDSRRLWYLHFLPQLVAQLRSEHLRCFVALGVEESNVAGLAVAVLVQELGVAVLLAADPLSTRRRW